MDLVNGLHDKPGLGANLVWPFLVVKMAYPDESMEFWSAAMHDGGDEAFDVLFDQLQLFLKSKQQS